MMPVKAVVALSLVCLDSARVWLSCQAIIRPAPIMLEILPIIISQKFCPFFFRSLPIMTMLHAGNSGVR